MNLTMRAAALAAIFVISATAMFEVAAETLEGYPNRVDFNFDTRPLVCPIASPGTFGWSNKLAVGAPAPEGAAGAVLWQELERGAMLYWEHPVYNPTTKEYIVQLFAVATGASPSPAVSIRATWGYAATTPSPGPASAPSAGVNGATRQGSGVSRFTTRNGSFRSDPIGFIIEIWAVRGGVPGCTVRLADYTFHNGNAK